MALETGSYITDLVSTNPVGASDFISRGDDHLRLIKNILRNTFIGFSQPFVVGTTAGSADEYTIATNPSIGALEDKTICLLTPHATNTGASTLNFNSLGAVNIKRVDGEDPEAGDIAEDIPMLIQYDSGNTVWRILSVIPNFVTKKYVQDNDIESTTRMLFQQTAAPTGWTKDTTANLDDTALRIVTGSVGSRTDQLVFSTVFGKTATDAHTLTSSQVPSMSGAINYSNGVGNVSSASGVFSTSGSITRAQQFDANGNTNASRVNFSFGGGGSHSHNMDIRVNYHDVIIATKD